MFSFFSYSKHDCIKLLGYALAIKQKCWDHGLFTSTWAQISYPQSAFTLSLFHMLAAEHRAREHVVP